MSLPRYPAYEASRFSWAEELPVHWRSASLKWVCQRYSGGTPDKNRPEYWENGTVPWLNSGTVNDGRIYEASAYITDEAFENSSAKWIPVGALVMALAGQGKTKGMVAQLMFASTCNQSMAAIVPTDRVEARCLYWWLVSNYQNIRNMAGGDLRDGLNLDLLGAIPCPLPPREEQTAIATFLDRETAKIDALIAEQEKLIALLAEKRQATISHAVTRGLNPNAPMKDSGVPWLGEVPAHWEVTPLKHLVGLRSGGTPSKDRLDYWTDGEVPWASAKDLKVDVLEDTGDHLTDLAILEGAAGLVEAGAVLVVVRGMILARTFPVSVAGVPMAINQDLKAVLASGAISSRYLPWLLRGTADESLRRLDEAGHGTKALRMDAWLTMKVPVPPIGEQEAIAEKVTDRLRAIDALLASAADANRLLQERRSALIAAAVTGQIDVRGVVPQSTPQEVVAA